MVKLAIRDDDMNYFTKVEDIESIYKDFNGFPISFAVIPEVLDVSTKGACPDTKGNTEPKYVGDNKQLVEWLKKQLAEGKCDVLLHGIHHSYKFDPKKGRQAEMQWRDGQTDLGETIRQWRDNLSSLFEYKITCFVAPSNKITKSCLKSVVDNGMDFSGIVPIKFNEEWSMRNLMNYLYRWAVRFTIKLPYPGVLKYSSHKELNACLLQSYDYLVKMFNYCNKHNLPMAINVHYWALRDRPQELEFLRKFVMDYAIPNGAIPTRISDIIKEG